jgi:hypothetical protein
MSGRVSLAPTNDRHDADRLHPLHRTESDRDLAYLIRTSLRFSAQQERGAQLADFIGDSQSREARICSVRSDSSSGGLPSRIGCTPRREGSGRPPGDVPRRRRSWQGPPAGRAGSRIPGALLAAAATGRCGSGLATALPVGSPPTSHTDIVVQVGFRPGRTLVAAGGISPCCCGTWPLT